MFLKGKKRVMQLPQNRYSRGKIYKIVSDCIHDIYVGATCEPTLGKRLTKHKGQMRLWEEGKYGYTSSYKILQQPHYDIVLIEEFPCQNKDQLHARERYWIENTPNCINKCIPTQTKKEYNEKNKDKIKEKRQQKITCQTCGSVVSKCNISTHTKTKKHLSFIKSASNPEIPEITPAENLDISATAILEPSQIL